MTGPTPHAFDTIVAISTPPGYSGIGVIRMSGPASLAILRRAFIPAGRRGDFPDRVAVYGALVDPAHGTRLDQGLALVMRAPSSYTGEDVVELSLHGSPVVLDLALRLLIRLGARPAAQGEFTRRAFLAGKLDLVQAEAVIDLIEARTPSAAEEAQSRLEKVLSGEIQAVSNALKDIIADVEAHIDFDEDDELTPCRPEPPIRDVLGQMARLADGARSGRIRREGVRAVIVGKPNVGKSTLFNALVKSDRVIVTPYPGTTRDPVDEIVLLSGMSFVLFDTAGIREDPDPIEEEGIGRTLRMVEQADLLVAVVDGTRLPDREDARVVAACGNKPTIMVLNKTDLGLAVDPADSGLFPSVPHRVPLSAMTGEGLAELESILSGLGREFLGGSHVESRGALNRRGALLVEAGMVPLRDLLRNFETGVCAPLDIVALELRRALGPLEEITGERVDEGVLDRIFERFCVGK